jgi:hypothetical protein
MVDLDENLSARVQESARSAEELQASTQGPGKDLRLIGRASDHGDLGLAL